MLFPTASVNAPPATSIVHAPSAVGVNVAVYELLFPAKLLIAPFETVISDAIKLVVFSLNANVNEYIDMNEFYFESIDGGYINLGDFIGRPILITNTASNCGFTRQYSELQKLHDDFSESGLVVLAIPSQDFFQEFNDNEKVKEFCNTNFSLTLPMTTITKVKGSNAHPLFKWLADKHNFRPVWNFNKVLLNKDGMFVASFGAFTNPNSRKIRSKILDLLKN